MLSSLSIRDFVIVEQLDLEFEPGYTVLTGETGAGKSILIDALSLVLGERGESGMVRAGCERAEITAEFDIRTLPELQRWLTDQELARGDTCLLRRILHADGRSRGFINGVPATLQQMREAGDWLVDIYSQHAHHSLLKTATQRALLDDFGGLGELAAQVAVAHKTWRTLHAQRIEVERNAAAYAEELAELREHVRALAQLAPTAEEWEALQQEHNRLTHAASLLEGTSQCRDLLAEGETAALRQLYAAQYRLRELCGYDPVMQEALDGLDDAILQIEETDRFLKKYLHRIELEPDRLDALDSRIQAIHTAARRHRVRPEELAELLIRWRQRIAELENAEGDSALARQEEAAHARYIQLASELSQGRKQAAQRLASAVSAEMQRLALIGGRFEIALDPLPEGNAYGLEQVEFLVASHAGMEPKPLSKVASGGELSRISLALRVVTARQAATPTMVFDEVDVGIGGGVAEIVGQLLKRLGETRQVLVITHLPQVAARGNHHLKVSKSGVDGATVSRIERLQPEQRIEEIARMLGGVEITDITRQHAAEMLSARE
ncbi:MAG: DNA repair protein RecN [Methylophilaceae bacterium]|nr:DNA repair protein RecN [Methylophilaceae bacterium]